MVDERDILWGLYQEDTIQCRQQEVLRAKATNLIVAISAGVLGLIALDHKVTLADLPLSVFLIVIGIFGAIISMKHYERFAMHTERSREYRNELEKLLPNTKIKALKKSADTRHNQRYPRLSKIRLNRLWAGLHLAIAVLGLVLGGFAVFS